MGAPDRAASGRAYCCTQSIGEHHEVQLPSAWVVSSHGTLRPSTRVAVRAGAVDTRRVHRSARRPRPSLRSRLLLGLALAGLPGCPRGGPEPELPEPAPLTAAEIAPEPGPPAATVPEGPLRYRGEVAVPGRGPLELFVELVPGSEGYAGTISMPKEGLLEAALGEITVAEGALSFALVGLGVRFTATLAPDGQVSECAFEQSGVTLPCTLEPTDEATLSAVRNPPRPQTPKPPFPYDAIEVEYDNEADGVHLAGTLTLPPGDGPHPAALLITGSGPQDRDESLLGHKPFLVLADHLTRQGIAVLRVDDRGVGGSTGTLADATGEALARDVAAGVAFLRGHARIDPDRVGLVGHSEGAIIGPRVAADDPTIAFVVMMAGTGVPGHEVIREQAAAIYRAKGATAVTVEQVRHRQAKALQVLLQVADDEDARQQLEEILGPNPQIGHMLTPWYRSFIAYDPAPALRRLRCPVLVLNGELDLQVLPDQNLPAIEKALAKNRKRVTVHRLPGLNHLFQAATTGAPEEYATIEQTLDPAVLELVGEWVVASTSRTRGR